MQAEARTCRAYSSRWRSSLRRWGVSWGSSALDVKKVRSPCASTHPLSSSLIPLLTVVSTLENARCVQTPVKKLLSIPADSPGHATVRWVLGARLGAVHLSPLQYSHLVDVHVGVAVEGQAPELHRVDVHPVTMRGDRLRVARRIQPRLDVLEDLPLLLEEDGTCRQQPASDL